MANSNVTKKEQSEFILAVSLIRTVMKNKHSCIANAFYL